MSEALRQLNIVSSRSFCFKIAPSFSDSARDATPSCIVAPRVSWSSAFNDWKSAAVSFMERLAMMFSITRRALDVTVLTHPIMQAVCCSM